jgi:HD-GYP domain-containing protein (c-di-GMP phosphodiesterase class II)
LTAVEFDIMKNHTVYGYDLLKSSKQPMLQSASVVALQHHERYDGKGYPNGLSKDEIHIFARIVSIADVFDALSTDRVYRKAWTLANTLEYMKRERDRQFDPFLLDIFINSIDTVKSIMNKLND